MITGQFDIDPLEVIKADYLKGKRGNINIQQKIKM